MYTFYASLKDIVFHLFFLNQQISCRIAASLFMDLAARKPDFGVCGQVRLNPACYATETGKNVVIKHVVIKHVSR